MKSIKLKPKMSMKSWKTKMGISIAFDALDLAVGGTVGVIPGVGELFDLAGTALGVWLWGPAGLSQAWEIVAPGPANTADGFIPTLTIVGFFMKP